MAHREDGGSLSGRDHDDNHKQARSSSHKCIGIPMWRQNAAMELSLSGNSLKTLHRCITCLARVGSELVLHASSSQVAFHTLNSSRSAYQSITFKTDFFDSCSILSSSSPEIRCSVLLKSVCSIFRTPVSSLSLLCLRLPSPDASKIQWTLHCQSGARKTYGISCNVEAEIQHLSLDRRRLPSSFVVRPRDLTRLLSNFQSSLQEITIIATDPSTAPSDSDGEIGGKAVELRSYIDPTKENSDATLHTQLWIDPAEEFLQYRHVDHKIFVRHSVREWNARLVFYEGLNVRMNTFVSKAAHQEVHIKIRMNERVGVGRNQENSDLSYSLILACHLASALDRATISTGTNVSDNQCHGFGYNPLQPTVPCISQQSLVDSVSQRTPTCTQQGNTHRRQCQDKGGHVKNKGQGEAGAGDGSLASNGGKRTISNTHLITPRKRSIGDKTCRGPGHVIRGPRVNDPLSGRRRNNKNGSDDDQTPAARCYRPQKEKGSAVAPESEH
ncbi:hypothetical protein KSP40_PGU022062 [Platanthera guangdongensis]|uniref:Uncharacterized protein n=1 Tax=Platanthera guangdongensis TaxID=2320717 RepID=A0ABR2M8M5_9ASPA